MYNKNQFKKVNDKKVLHKIKKRWAVISVALLGLIGCGAVATNASANTTTQTNNNSDQANHSLTTDQSNNQQSKLVNNGIHTQSNISKAQNPSSLNEDYNNQSVSDTITKKATNLHNNILRNVEKSSSISLTNNHANSHAVGDMYSDPQTAYRSWDNLSNNVKFISDGDNGNNGGDIMEVTSGTVIKPVLMDNNSSSVYPPALPFDLSSNNWKLVLDSDVALEVGPSDQLGYTFSGQMSPMWSHFKSIDLSNAHIKKVNNDSSDESDNESDDIGNEPTMSDFYEGAFTGDTNLQDLNIDMLPDYGGATNLNGAFQDDTHLTNLKLSPQESFEKNGNVIPEPLDDPNLILVDSNGSDVTSQISDGSEPGGWYYVAKNALIHLVDSDGNTVKDTTVSILLPDNPDDNYLANITSQISDALQKNNVSIPQGRTLIDNPNSYYKIQLGANETPYINAEVSPIPAPTPMPTPNSGSDTPTSSGANIPNSSSNSSSSSANSNSDISPSDMAASIESDISIDYNNEFKDGTQLLHDLNQSIHIYDDICSESDSMIADPLFKPSNLDSLSQQNISLANNENTINQNYTSNSNAINSLNLQLQSISARSANIDKATIPSVTKPKLLGGMSRRNLMAFPSNNNAFSTNYLKLSSLAFDAGRIAAQTNNMFVKSYANTLQSMDMLAQLNNANYNNDMSEAQSYSSQATYNESVATSIHNEPTNHNINSLESLGNKANQFNSIAESYTNDEENVNSSAMSLIPSVAKNASNAKSMYSVITQTVPYINPSSALTTSFESTIYSKASSTVNATDSIDTSAKVVSNASAVNAINSYANNNKNISLGLNSLGNSYANDNVTSISMSNMISAASNISRIYESEAKSAKNASNSSLEGLLQYKANAYGLIDVENKGPEESNNNNMMQTSSEIDNDLSLMNNNYQDAKNILSLATNTSASASASASASVSASASASASVSASLSNSIQASISLSQYNSSINAYNSRQASIRNSESINNSIANSIASSIADSEAHTAHNTSNTSISSVSSFITPISLNSIASINSNSVSSSASVQSSSASSSDLVNFGNSSVSNSSSLNNSESSVVNSTNNENTNTSNITSNIQRHKTSHQKSLSTNEQHSNDSDLDSNHLSNNTSESNYDDQQETHYSNQSELDDNHKVMPVSPNVNSNTIRATHISNNSQTNSNNSDELPQTNEVSSKSKEMAEISLIMSTTFGALAMYIDKHRDNN